MTTQGFQEQLQLLPDYLGNHLLLTVVALAFGVCLCLPLGCLITRVKRLQWPTLAVAGVLQTIPGIALLALMVPLLGTIGFVPALIALTIYSFLPILRNTVTGILEVDPAVVEAARGIGMTDRQMLIRVELPLALPVIIAGIRTATVWVVGTATLATPVGATSLGNYIFSGLQTQNLTAVIVGCLAAAGLAILLDQLIHLIEISVTRRSLKLGVVTGLILAVLLAVGMAPLALRAGEGRHSSRIQVGSKPFTEQYILAQLITDLLNEQGIEAENRPGMGSIILFEALTEGSIDCYVDYSGTIWTNVMKREDLPPREEILTRMTDWLRRKYNVTCLGPLGFENTYALAVKNTTAQQYHLRTIDDLARIAPQLSMGSDYEFYSRPEWQALKTAYKLQFRQLRTFDPTLMYQAVDNGQVDVISAYSTDGRIAAYDLMILEDTRQALPPYDAVLLLSPQAATRSELITLLEPLISGIDNNAMRSANKLVDIDGSSTDSAAAYLQHLLEAEDF